MSKKKLFIGAILTAVIGIVLFGAVLTIWLDREKEHTTLERIAYDKCGRESVVYIKEEDEYIPYLVLAADYEGNVLLLREYLLPEEMPYEPSPLGNGLWPTYEYGSYYEKSSIDKFLNTDFLGMFSSGMQEAIVDTKIEITDIESYHGPNRANVTRKIDRKVFLLSAVELGVDFSVGYCMTKEGMPLKYFENARHSVRKACKADREAWPYWTRTPWIGEWCEVNVIGVEKTAAAPADRLLGVRPAFCMGKDTAVQKNNNIIDGESVYVLELENE